MPASLLAPTRTLSVVSAAIPTLQGVAALEAVSLSGHEGINQPPAWTLLLKTADALTPGASVAADMDLDAMVGREISCVIELDGAGEYLPGAVGASTDHLGAGTREINLLIAAASFEREG